MCDCGAPDCVFCGLSSCPGHFAPNCPECAACADCGCWFYDTADYAEPVPSADEEAPLVCWDCHDEYRWEPEPLGELDPDDLPY